MIDIYIKHSDEIGFYKGKSPNVSRLINNVLMSQKQENNIIEKVFTVLMNSVKESALKHPEQAFQQVISFLNSFFKEIEIKKMYNTIPRTPLSRYAKQNLRYQLLHNVYDKSWQNFYQDNMEGGNCHYWTVLLWKLFEKLKNSWWLDITTKSFVYKGEFGHSGILVQHWKEVFLADVSWFNDSFHRLITNIETLNTMFKTTDFSLFTRKNTPPKGISYFHNLEEFVDYVENKPKSAAKVIFYPILEEKIFKISLTFYKNSLIFSINETQKQFCYNKNINKYLKKSDSYHILDIILKNIIATVAEKQEIEKHFQMIRHKISQDELYQILRGTSKEEKLLKVFGR